ncbi:uncharacterized protein LOC120874167 [Oryx dammah]|uniref:uncharacterized protein LOC120874167 n=1 Tax=Oryx dammah TaxID=59534 RepID=UPI001A9BBA7D|nr:uncharacterized protein LOC120874167 [Oryx dammah]
MQKVRARHTAVPFARTSPPFGTSRSAPLWAREEVDPCTWGGRVTRAACLEGGVIRAVGHVVGLASSSPLPSEVGGLDSCKVLGARGRQAVSPSLSCPMLPAGPVKKQRAGRGATCGPSGHPYSRMPSLSQSSVQLCTTMPGLWETGLPPGSRFTDVRPLVGQEFPEKPHQWDACVRAHSLSRVRLFVTPWTVAHQAPRSMGFSRQECWSGPPCPPPGDLPTQGWNSHLLRLVPWRVFFFFFFLPLGPSGKPTSGISVSVAIHLSFIHPPFHLSIYIPLHLSSSYLPTYLAIKYVLPGNSSRG